MSQPQPESTPADGAAALLAAADKTGGGRRQRYVPAGKKAAKPAADKPAEAAAPQPDAPAAQVPPPAAEPVQETKDTGDATPAAQEAPEPPPAEPVEKPKAEAPASPPETPRSGAQAPPPPPETPNSSGEVGFPSKPLSFESVFTPRTHDMDPEMFAMVQQRQEKLLKSMANIVKMFNERRGEFDKSVRAAVASGFPKAELVKLAVAHDCLPLLEAALGEQFPGTAG